MIGGRCARRRLDEAVVEHVQRDRDDAEPEQPGLAPEHGRETGKSVPGARAASCGCCSHGESYAAAGAVGIAGA
jgi:hypothetical protein